jgi:hypothetical protein
LLTIKSARVLGKFLNNLKFSKNLNDLVLDSNTYLGNSGVQELAQSLAQRMNLCNSNMYKEHYGIKEELIVLPLNSLSLANTGIDDVGFKSVMKMLIDV